MYLLLEPNLLPQDNAGNGNIGYHDDIMTYKRFKLYRPFVFPFFAMLMIRYIPFYQYKGQNSLNWVS